MDIEYLTPVEYIEKEGIWLKRDDKFEVCGVRGGKSRSAYQVIVGLIENGYKTIVTAGSRQSPQCEIVSFICESLGVDCVLFMPYGGDTSVISNIRGNRHTRIEQVRPGYNNVIVARAREYAENRGCGYVPFGMECEENVYVTSKQVVNIPNEVERLVVPVGSGMSLSSIITGLTEQGRTDLPILGVRVGKDPSKILEKYAFGLDLFNFSLVQSRYAYHTPVDAWVGDVNLDPIYEAKCVPFLERGDLLWVVGHRR